MKSSKRLLLTLILVDQVSKAFAVLFLPPIHFASHNTPTLGWWIHPPHAFSLIEGLAACACAYALWLLPLPKISKILWIAAAVSNHVEMILRPGTIDFIAIRIWDRVLVANIADAYFIAGTVILLLWLAHRVWNARSWSERMTHLK